MGLGRSAARSVGSGAVLALVLTTGVVAGVSPWTPLRAAADEDVDPEPVVECVDQAPDAESAGVIAAQCDLDVLVEDELSPWETVYSTAEGLTRLEVSAVAERTRISGEWGAIDTSVVAGPDGLRVVAPVWEMAFSDGRDGVPLASITREGHELTFDVPFELSEPVVEGDTVTYPAVLPGVDLIVAVNEDGTGFSEVLRVESAQAAANPALAELTFPVEVSDGLELVEADGGFEALDGAGETVFSAPVPLMWDSATMADDFSTPGAGTLGAFSALSDDLGQGDAGEPGVVRRGVVPLEGDRVEAMPVELDDETVTIRPDAEMLGDAETVWPVFIDPSVSGTRHEWTLIRSAVPSTVAGFKFSGDQGVGLCDPGATSACTRANDRYRLIWEFSGLSTIGGLSSANVESATFSAYGAHSWDCTARGVQAYRVENISSTTTWNSSSGWTDARRASSVSVAHRPSCSGAPARWIEWDVTSAAKWVASNSASTLSIGLKATSEASMAAGWKRYRNDARLSVVYNRPPSTPTNLRTTNPTTTCVTGANRPIIRSASPVLRAQVRDPDGGNVRAKFEVYTSGGSLVRSAPITAARSSGSEHTYTVPAGTLVNNTVYQWRVNGRDPQGLNGPVARCEFLVDTEGPGVPPGVSPVAGQAGVYPENQTGGGVGQTGQFRFTNGGVSDVVSYKYSFGNDALGQSVTVASGATVSYTPTKKGSQRLYVQSVDRAGWTSPIKLYRFSAGFPGVDAAWTLDEGTGTLAADTSGGGNHLTVSSPDLWAPGPFADYGFDPSDRALRFAGAGQFAGSSEPVVAINESYTVMAFVKLDVATSTRTAVSQDGEYMSGFKLGARTDPGCPTVSGMCWAIWAPSVDGPSAGAWIKSMSDIEIETDTWVHLTGVHDAENQELRMYVCEVKNLATGHPEPVQATATPYAPTWSAGGALQIGRGQYNGGYVDAFPGTVDDVRVFDIAVADEEIRKACHKELA